MLIKTKFKDLVIIKKKKFIDKRGYFQELYDEKIIKKKFVFNVMSFSKKNVLRGLHIQTKNPQGKLVTVIKGKILDIALDLRKKSKTFGKAFNVILSEKNSKSVYLPPGFAHGFLALSNENYLCYSCTERRHKNSETTIQFDDKNLGIKLPKKKFIISKKDHEGISLLEYKKIHNV
jgi:dTDP-4-dehydrorhamnose 3,5-epimerase